MAACTLLKALGAKGLVSPAADAHAISLLPSPASYVFCTPSTTSRVSQLLNPPEEIESMANSFFHRVYTGEQSIDEVCVVGGEEGVVKQSGDGR